MEINERNKRIRKINRLKDEIYCLVLRFEMVISEEDREKILVEIKKKRNELKAVEEGE